VIHKTAIIDPDAQIGANVSVGPFAIIESGTIIGDNNEIGARSHIKTWTRIGNGNRILEGAILGGSPQHISYKGEETWLKIGHENYIGEYVTIHRGTSISGKTIIGEKNYIMGYSHIGHDCRVGSSCVFTSYSGVAGHCEIEDRALLGAYAGLHQFTRVGTMAMIGAGSKVGQDVVPYVIVQGFPARPRTVNSIGLQRNKMPEDQRSLVKKMFKILFRSGLSTDNALLQIKELPENPVVSHMIEFIEGSDRGICG